MRLSVAVLLLSLFASNSVGQSVVVQTPDALAVLECGPIQCSPREICDTYLAVITKTTTTLTTIVTTVLSTEYYCNPSPHGIPCCGHRCDIGEYCIKCLCT